MFIACPACATRYAVPDGAIGADGRVVRCARCRHSWFEDGMDRAAQPVSGAILQPVERASAEQAIAEQAGAERPIAEPAVAPSPVAEPAAAWGAEPAAPRPPDRTAPRPDEPARASVPAPRDVAASGDRVDAGPSTGFADMPSSFAYEPPFVPRRRRISLWLVLAVVLAVLAVAAIGAVAALGVPSWLPLPRGTLAQAQPDLILDFPQERQQREATSRKDTDFFNISGSIRNAGNQRRAVPTLLIALRDAHNDIVYSLEAAPPKASLAPGESETVEQAIIGAPSSARSAEIGWKQR